MKQTLFAIILLSFASAECFGQWRDAYFPNPITFGEHDSSFFAFGSNSSGKGLYKIEPTGENPFLWPTTLADTGINPAYFPIVGIGSIGPYLLVDAGYRSTNNGSSWTPMNNLKFVPSCFATMGDLVFSGGIAGSGVWRSTDSGLDWVPAYSGLADLNVRSLVASGTTIFAGTKFSGVFRSTDSGQHWQATSMTTAINGLAVLGTNIFTTTYGKNFGADAGVYCSSDNGIHWKQDTVGLFNRIVSTLVTNGRYLFAGTGAEAGDGSYVYGSGIFMSTDSGQHWDTINYGLPQNTPTGSDDYLSVNALGVFDTLLFVGVWDGAGTDNRTYFRSIPEILRQKGDTTASVVSEPVIASDSIVVYPNPASGVVTIRSAGTRILGVRVLNIMGTEVLTIPRGYNSELHLDVSQLPSGTYFLEVETMDGMILRKITRE